jgi:hypothetical protein
VVLSPTLPGVETGEAGRSRVIGMVCARVTG